MGSPPIKQSSSSTKAVGTLSPDKTNRTSKKESGMNPIVIILGVLSVIILIPLLLTRFFKPTPEDVPKSSQKDETNETPENEANSEVSQEVLTEPDDINSIMEKYENLEQD